MIQDEVYKENDFGLFELNNKCKLEIISKVAACTFLYFEHHILILVILKIVVVNQLQI